MKRIGDKFKSRNNSAFVILAACAVVFMFIATLFSVFIYGQRMTEAANLLDESEYSEYDSYVIMISSDDSADFWKQVYKSAYTYGQQNGVYVDLISDNTNLDYSKQDLIKMAVESRPDCIFLEGDDSPETISLMSEARNAGITVIALQTDVATDARVSYISANNYTMATLYAQALLSVLNDGDQVMFIQGPEVNAADAAALIANVQEQVVAADLNVQPTFELRAVDSKDAFATEEYVQNLFKENDLGQVIICLDELSTTRVYQSMIDYNKVGTIKLLGYYQSDTILTGIKQRVIESTVTVDATNIGVSAVNAYMEYRDTGYVSDYISVEPSIINADNVNEYIRGDGNE
ncbi:MAG: substrate-binding domain-containing protein [Pseudobutyrivibrio sp.]|nr:substrate-binding domain-containing protein [Pseudobutyrivibrio sp.]